MGWKSFVVEMSKSWAWPLAWGFFLWKFYPHITRLVSTAIRTLRRMQRFKFGDLEFASGVVQAAAEANAATADAVEQKIASEDLSADERQQLLEQLKEAIAERERLRAILEVPPPRALEKIDVGLRVPAHVIASRAIQELARALGPATVAEQFNSDVDGLFGSVNQVLAGGHIDKRSLAMMLRVGWVNEDGTLSDAGLMRLLGTAKDLHAKAQSTW